MALLRIAYAGFLRYRKRRRNFTIILIGGYFLIIFFLSFFNTVNRNLQEFWVKDYVGGDIIVAKKLKQYDFMQPVAPEHYFRYTQFLTANPAFRNQVSPCLRVGALLESKTNGRSLYCIMNGVDLKNKRGLERQLDIIEGRLFRSDQFEVVLPEAIAASLKAKLGDSIVIYVVTPDGYYNFELIKVVGFLNVSFAVENIANQTMIFMPLNKMRELTTVGADEVSELISVKKAGLFPAQLHSDYRKVNGVTSFSIVRSLHFAFYFLEIVILLLILAITLSSIYHNVVLMNSEREKEIGIYLTSGAGPFWIRKLMFYELLIYSAYCSVWGGLLGCSAIIGFNSLGIYPINNISHLLLGASRFEITNQPGMYAVTFLVMLVMMFGGSVRPIWKATGKVRIMDLFRKAF